jgi:hypothetical protein
VDLYDWLAIIGAVCTGIATIITAYAGLLKVKRDSKREANDAVHALRMENERLAAELHELKMRWSSES